MKNQKTTVMKELKDKTLLQVRNALEAIEEQREADNLKKADRLLLEQAAVALRNIERTITREKEEDMVAVLEKDSKELKGLSESITKSAKKLEGLAVVVAKASTVVEGLIKIIATAVGAGLL